MVRIEGMEGKVREGIELRRKEGRKKKEKIDLVMEEVGRIKEEKKKCMRKLRKEMEKENIEIVRKKEL